MTAEMCLGIASFVLAVATLFVALSIYKRQSKEHALWASGDGEWKAGASGALTDLDEKLEVLGEMIRELAEQNAVAERERIEADSDPGDDEQVLVPGLVTSPQDETKYTADLKAQGVELDFDHLHWEKKTRCDGGGRGNLGWFVSDGGDQRYYIHRGRRSTVRLALPRSLLQAWQQETGKRPCEIELDYRTGVGPGNHAWFVRTYEGKTWRIALGGKSKTSPTVTPLD